jgi:translocation and assembly module TamB
VGGGTLRASGGIVYRPTLTMNLALSGNQMRLLYPGGVRAEFGTNLALTGTRDSSLLRGQVRIEQLSFTKDFDLQSFMGQLGGGAATPPPKGGFTQNLKLNVGVISTGGVNLQSRQLAVQGTANLRVEGTGAQPVILGRVNLNGGDLIFAGNRYILQSGTIDFVNPAMTQPVVNVNITTTIKQYNIQMRFWGPADHLHTAYTSDPALPPADIINLVARGTTTEAAAANPSPPGMLGAESLVASGVTSQVTSRISEIAGISQLSIDPVLGGNGQSPGARIAIQQRVTGKIFVDFSTDVTSTQDQVIRLEYHATPKVSLSGTRDQNGGFGFDVKVHKNW